MADFVSLAGKGYGPALLPIIPPGAQISQLAGSRQPTPEAQARAREQVTASRGKIPGKRDRDGTWFGFGKWAEHTATAADHARWSTWDCGAGIQAANFPGIDIDVSDEDFVRAMIRFIDAEIGFIYGRVGRKPRILIPTRAVEGYEPAKHRLTLNDGDAIELLGAGQQYLIEGIHPKTGLPYSWGKRGLPDARDLPVLTAENVERIFAKAAELAGVNPGNLPATVRRTTEVQSTEPERDFSEIEAVVKAIENTVDYETWLKVGVAIKNCTRASPEGLELWIEWSLGYPGNDEAGAVQKWESFYPPYYAGFDTLRALAPAAAAELAAFDFTEVKTPPSAYEAMFERFVWVEKTKMAFDRDERKVLDQLQFSVQNNHLGDPTSSKSAWAQLLAHPKLLKRASSVTYRPGREEFVDEETGRCVNVWQGCDFTPVEITDCDVSPWLEHMRYLIESDHERNVMFDWLAMVVQKQDEKPNWQLVWGSTNFGVGKDMALEPLRTALGGRNVRTVNADAVLSPRTDWFENARLIIVSEMKSYGKRELENKLRTYTAAPPHYVPISKVYCPVYEVPNIAGLIFLTNEKNAVPLPSGDRRYFVSWSEAEPQAPEYYQALADWYAAGGQAKVASWLMARDIAAFNHRAPPPMTDAKAEMQAASMSPLEAWIADGIADETGPFAADIVEVADVLARIPKEFQWGGGTARRLSEFLRRAGCVRYERQRLGAVLPSTGSDRGVLFTVRRHEMYASLSVNKMVELFWQQRESKSAGAPPVEMLL